MKKILNVNLNVEIKSKNDLKNGHIYIEISINLIKK